MHLKNRIAIVIGSGQTPGETIGNGRATALRFAREGARLLLVDKRPDSAEETARMIADEGGEASVFGADITVEKECRAIAETCVSRYGRIDILHNNVGVSEGDAGTVELIEENWERLMGVNLKGMFLTIKHVLPVMRAQKSGVIINVSSIVSISSRPTSLAYKTAKAGVNAMTQNLAIENAPYGIRVNAILPGLMDTPMAIERRARERGVDREIVRRERDATVPLGQKMGTAWDVAAAALFLASDEARYITGILLPVDGGLSARVG
jgi:NAD(P)-dependent dehydrogenase (short-subunit alcohol dehydrogenase family)